VKDLARYQERPINDIVVDALKSYVDEQEWESIFAYGKAQAKKLGYTEADVDRLIAEVRQEHSEGAK